MNAKRSILPDMVIILSSRRTGTWALSGVFRLSENYIFMGEVLNPHIAETKSLRPFISGLKPEDMYDGVRQYAAVHKAETGKIPVLAIHQDRNIPDGGILELLIAAALDRQKLIHVTRLNKLRQFVSLKIAEKTGVFREKNRKSVTFSSIKIDPKEALYKIIANRSRDFSYGSAISAFDNLQVSYENMVLSDNYNPEFIEKFQSFIPDIGSLPSRPWTWRQNSASLREIIENNDEVEQELSRYGWQSLMDDEIPPWFMPPFNPDSPVPHFPAIR